MNEQKDRSQCESEVRWLYEQVISSWDKRDAKGFAESFAEDAIIIGYDGSLHAGKYDLKSTLSEIFSAHPTPPYVCKIKSIKFVDNISILHAIVGMIPPGKDELEPKLNAHQVMMASKGDDGQWLIHSFQNTPAAFHGRPELIDAMTDELNEILKELKQLEPKRP